MVFFRLFEVLGIDFPQFYEASYMWLHGQNPYQTLLTSPGPFNYPPPSFFFLWWMGLLPYHVAGPVWNILSLASFLLSIYLVMVLALKKRPTLLQIGSAFFLLTALFFPIKFNLGNGQMNNFILLFSVLSLWFYSRQKKLFSAGFLAYAICIKLTPAVFLFPLLIRKDWKQIGLVMGIVVALFLASFLFIPASMQKVYYSEVIYQGFPLQGKEVYYNQSLMGLLTRSFSLSLAPYLYYMVSFVMLGVSWWRARRWQSDIVKLWAMATCLYLMLHPLTWQHHYVFAVVPLLVTWIHQPNLLTVFAYGLIATNIKQPNNFPEFARLLLSHQFWGAFLLWIATVRYDTYKIKPAS